MTGIWLFLLIMAVIFGGSIFETAYRRLSRIEGKVDAILKELGDLEFEIKKMKRGE